MLEYRDGVFGEDEVGVLGFERMVVVKPACVDERDITAAVLGQHLFCTKADDILCQFSETGASVTDGNNVLCAQSHIAVSVN